MKRVIKHLETRRQLVHIASGLVILLLLYSEFMTKSIIVSILAAGIIISLISRSVDIPVISWFLDKFERPEERKRFPGKGAFFLFAGGLITISIFPKQVALAAIAILTFGDSISHIVGRFYGKRKHPLSDVKLIEGSIAGTIAGALAAMLFVTPLQASLAALIAMVYEAAELRMRSGFLDDNIIVPLVAGTVISLMVIYL